MNRRKFLGLAGTSVVVAGTAYLLSDRQHYVRADIKKEQNFKLPLNPVEIEILYLASLAPSGHNTQPWMVKYIEPYRWIIKNDKSKWLPAVDPTQRETILSIGAFVQNLEYAASHFSYSCEFTLLAVTNQDEDIMEVKLKKTSTRPLYDINKIRLRRTVRSGYLNQSILNEHIDFLIGNEKEYFHYFPNISSEYEWLNEQTIEANRQQTDRDDAQSELADWMRLSSNDARKHSDGLSTASMEINGIAGWVVRNFYSKENIMSKNFRQQSLDKIKEQVNSSGGWILITSNDNSPAALIETGARLQRMLLRTREKSIAMHPMTQLLEEVELKDTVNKSIGISHEVQFIIRAGYIEDYPPPVSLRRPVKEFFKI